ncbi:type IX secretion system sortase PorU [candidate division KSB1 bacterium]|nr:type IX secretion system sortase PorU [candidate division KSB1 bacterium]
MNQKKLFVRFALMVLLIIFSSESGKSQSVKSDTNYKLLRSDKGGVQIVFTPKIEKENNLINGTSKTRYQYSQGYVFSKPGEPEIPVQTFVVGIPEYANPKVTIISSSMDEETGIDLVPLPVYDTTNDLPQLSYPDFYSVDNEDAWFPSNPIIIEEPAYFSDLRILRIHVVPIQYHIKSKTIRKYQQIEFRIDFLNSSSNLPASGINSHISKGQEDLYKTLVLNYDQAKNWLRSRKQTLKKPGRYWLQGDYYKIIVNEDGVYRITGDFLQQNGINISSIDPSTIKLFNNGARPLPRDINTNRPDSLVENAIQLFGMDDGRFDTVDYILFYGTDVKGWYYSTQEERLKHFVDPYTLDNIYWLTFNEGSSGKRMAAPATPSSITSIATTYQAAIFIEEDIANIHHSGLIWYGKQFIKGLDDEERTFPLNLPNLMPNSNVEVYGNFLSTAGSSHSFEIRIDNEKLGEFNFFGTRIHESGLSFTLTNPSSSPSLNVKYFGTSAISIAYLDWFEIFAESELQLVDDHIDFYGNRGTGSIEYKIAGATDANYNVYNITNLANIQELEFTFQNLMITFRDFQNPDLPGHYIVVKSDQFKTISGITLDEPSDLRNPNNSADFLIITHESFSNAASSLKNLRESVDGLSTTIVKITDVFDEFSAGRYDPTAIRDFLKYVYENWSKRPQYVLLFGDGDYDYRNILSNDENWLPSYQTEEPGEIENRTVEDWFTYVSGNDQVADYTIGRIPAQTTEEAENLIDKLVEYESTSNFGPWRNLITLVADDELVTGGVGEETIHTRDTELLAENFIPKRFDIRKIYLTEYPVVYDASASGVRKPSASEDLLAQMNQGTLIINFIGHGSPQLWTHERVLLDSRDFEKIQNGNRYIFFITATCDFGRFDDPQEQSMAEKLLMVEGRGAIGLLTSARLVYASSNARFNKSYVKFLFTDPAKPLRVGDAMRLAKVNSINDQKFLILGDPTLILKVPKLNVIISDFSPDSLKALSLISVEGYISDENNTNYTGGGKTFLKTFDSRRQVVYTTKNGQRISYIMPGNPIFRGTGTVENGQFQMNFIVPKDISYGGRQGRMSFYFEGEETDGTGFVKNLIVDGTAYDLIDHEGPDIRFFVKGTDVIDFALLNKEDKIEIKIEDDKSGINITGDVGHKITATADNDAKNIREVTQYFEYETNNYLKGSLTIPLTLFPEFQNSSLSDETHTLTIKAWDNSNNSSKQSLSFTLIDGDRLVIDDVLNYPNPFLDNTTFTFVLSADAEVEIKVFTIAGRLIAELDPFQGTFGFNMFEWDGRDQDGDELANGVYFYRLKAKGVDSSREFIGKMIKME